MVNLRIKESIIEEKLSTTKECRMEIRKRASEQIPEIELNLFSDKNQEKSSDAKYKNPCLCNPDDRNCGSHQRTLKPMLKYCIDVVFT